EGGHADGGAPAAALRDGAHQCEDQARRGGDRVHRAGLQPSLGQQVLQDGMQRQGRVIAAATLHAPDLPAQAKDVPRPFIGGGQRRDRPDPHASILEERFEQFKSTSKTRSHIRHRGRRRPGYAVMMRIEFESEVTLWDARAESWFFATLPEELSAEIRELPAPRRGFGSLRVQARIGLTIWSTSIFFNGSAFVLPLK